MSERCQNWTHAPQQIWRCQSKNGSRRLPLARPRQYDLELGEKSGLRLDINAAAMLFHDDVVAHGQAKPGAFTRRLGREERGEYFNLVSEVLRCSRKHWLEAVTAFRSTFRRGIETVRYQIEEDPCDLLRIDISHADRRIKIAVEGHTESSLFCPGTVIGQVQALIDYRVNVSRTMLARTFPGMLQHVFHNG